MVDEPTARSSCHNTVWLRLGQGLSQLCDVCESLNSFRSQGRHGIDTERSLEREPAREQCQRDQQTRNSGNHPRQIANPIDLQIIALNLITRHLDSPRQQSARCRGEQSSKCDTDPGNT
jgi:hypothetical protein